MLSGSSIYRACIGSGPDLRFPCFLLPIFWPTFLYNDAAYSGLVSIVYIDIVSSNYHNPSIERAISI